MPMRRRLIILFLSIAIIPILFIGLLDFSNAKDELLKAKTERLEVIADLKVDKIKTFFEDATVDTALAQQYYTVKTYLPVLIEYVNERTNPEYIKAKEILNERLRVWLEKKKEMVDIKLLSPEGKIVYVANERMSGDLNNTLPDPTSQAFREGKKGIYLSEIFPVQDRGYNFGMFVTAPVYDFEKRFIGLFAFEINMEPIYKFMQDTAGLGQTGETLIVQKKISRQGTADYKGREGEYVLFLNPLRYDPEAALKKIVFVGDKSAQLSQLAAKGEEGFGFYTDYRGKEVLAVWRYIPSLGWGLIAKMDMQEILTTVNTLRDLTIIICVIVGIIVVIIALVISNSISNPIHILHKGTEIIGNGNLDHKVGTDAKDEIGQLSRAFDQMTGRLKAQMEETKAANQQLKASNQQLRATEQQLRANNQQLRAGEQQLRAANEQLQAHEQELRAANEQLRASEQQLRAANEQLRASEQQLRAGIEERKKVEQAIRESEQNFRQLFDSSNDGIIVADAQTRQFFMCNKTICRMMGYTEDEFVRLDIKGIHLEKDLPRAIEGFERLLRKDTILIEALPVKRKDGSIFLADIVGTKVRFGEKEYLMGSFRDITERNKAEESLQHAAQEWRATFDSITDMVSIHDKDYKIVRVNRSFADRFKMNPQDIIGKTCYELIHGTSQPPATCPHKYTLETKEPRHAEYFESHLDKYLEVSTSPIFDEKGELIASVHIARDITPRKKIEENQRLTELGKLVADMAHEVNNPLMIISGNAQLCLMEEMQNKEVENNLKIIFEESKRAKDIIQRLLKFSRPSKGEIKKIDINNSIEAVLKLIEHQFILANVQIQRNYVKELPYIFADEKQLQEVFMNLLNNSRDAMPKGGEIKISTLQEGDFLRLDFKDTGCGMTEEIKSKIFEPFFTTKEKGTGLGLAVCYGIIKSHQGELKFESEPGKGATATVLLPIRGV
jgi:PAS domain S-box-containing protein